MGLLGLPVSRNPPTPISPPHNKPRGLPLGSRGGARSSFQPVSRGVPVTRPVMAKPPMDKWALKDVLGWLRTFPFGKVYEERFMRKKITGSVLVAMERAALGNLVDDHPVHLYRLWR